MPTLIEAILALIGAILGIALIFTPAGRASMQNVLTNIISAVFYVATPLLTALEGSLLAVAQAFVSSIGNQGSGISNAITGPAATLATSNLGAAVAALTTAGLSTPANAAAQAGVAMGQAFGFGVASHGVATLYEAVFPEKLNTLAGVGPIISEMAGFKEVASTALEPLYENAFGKSLDYYYKSVFQPDYPDEKDATIWYARGLLQLSDLEEVFQYSGLKAKYESAYLASAYRAVSPFILARATATGVIGNSDLTSILTFGGYRPQDQTLLLAAFNDAAIDPSRRAATAAFVSAAIAGLYTGTAITSELNSLNVLPAAQPYIQQEIAYRQLEKLAADFIKSNNEGYKYGTVTDAEYVINLENAGIAENYASALYAIASVAKTGKAAAAATLAAARLANAQNKASIKAATEQYLTGTIPVAALVAQLALTTLDPTLQAYLVEYLTAKFTAEQAQAYGVTGTKTQIALLREKVGAVQQQVQKAALTGQAALQTLGSLNIPSENAQALVSAWLAYGQATIAPI